MSGRAGGQSGAAPDPRGRLGPLLALFGTLPVILRILYLASVREKLGTETEEIEPPAGVATIAGLRTHLQARGGAWAEALADGRLLRTAVNQDMAPAAATIKPCDEVAFFPRVTGG